MHRRRALSPVHFHGKPRNASSGGLPRCRCVTHNWRAHTEARRVDVATPAPRVPSCPWTRARPLRTTAAMAAMFALNDEDALLLGESTPLLLSPAFDSGAAPASTAPGELFPTPRWWDGAASNVEATDTTNTVMMSRTRKGERKGERKGARARPGTAGRDVGRCGFLARVARFPLLPVPAHAPPPPLPLSPALAPALAFF